MAEAERDRRASAGGEPEAVRVDKWLWFARFFKSRSLASQFCATGRIRIGGNAVNKASHIVRLDDVLTFPLHDRIRVVRIVALGTRRGPAREAVLLYEDLSPQAEASSSSGESGSAVASRLPGSGRPTKRDRRHLDRLRDS
jgi:ribosome-associated heat shock protein Hsp15